MNVMFGIDVVAIEIRRVNMAFGQSVDTSDQVPRALP